MSRYETLLFLHLLSAFALVTSLVLFAAMLVSARRATPTFGLSGLATILWNIGGVGVLVFGVWMAIDLDAYEILDGWVIAAIVLWIVASAAGGPLTRLYREGTLAQSARPLVLTSVMSLATLLLLIDMIYKPGA